MEAFDQAANVARRMPRPRCVLPASPIVATRADSRNRHTRRNAQRSEIVDGAEHIGMYVLTAVDSLLFGRSPIWHRKGTGSDRRKFPDGYPILLSRRTCKMICRGRSQLSRPP